MNVLRHWCGGLSVGLAFGLAGCALDASDTTGPDESVGVSQEEITAGGPDGSVHREVVSLPTLGCSGVVVSERYVLTAGHCVDSAIGFPGASSGTISSLRVVFSSDGVTRTTVYDGKAKAAVAPNYIYEFVDGPGYPEYDMALIKLDADMSKFVPARLQVLNFVMPAREELVGWGRHDGFIPAFTQRFSGVAKLSSWGGDGFLKLEENPAAGDPGDSGGGVFVKPSSSSSARVLTGTIVGGNGNETLGSMVALHLDFIFGQASTWGRPLTCASGTLGSVQFKGPCTD